jgi:sarcosine oxidase/L-pipecolate oxidase
MVVISLYSLFLNAITENELEIELENMKSNKSSGYDSINAKIIKIIAKEISKPLTHIFNLSFSYGIIPDNLKVELITSIFKCNEDNKFENYRPISVLTCFSKLLEKLVVKRLKQFIDKNNILSKHQYGFRQNRSTEHAIIDFVDKITTAIDQGKFSVGIFLDLSKAFETINHKIQIRKLQHYGIRGVVKKMVRKLSV